MIEGLYSVKGKNWAFLAPRSFKIVDRRLKGAFRDQKGTSKIRGKFPLS